MKNRICKFLALFISTFSFAQCNFYEVSINTTTGTWAEEMSWLLLNNSNEVLGAFQGIEDFNNTQYTDLFCLEQGCYQIKAIDAYADGWNGGEIEIVSQGAFGEIQTYNYALTGDDVSLGYFFLDLSASQNCEFTIQGCMNSIAENYNEFANQDDGTCIVLQQFYATGYSSPRDYFFYKPSTAQSQAPLVFVAHGYSGSALEIMNYSGFIDLANEFGFALCFPQGIKDDSNNAFWNVGYNFHEDETVNDVVFFTELAQYLQSTFGLAESKTFCTGMSNGADLSYLLAFEASETFSAIGSVAGTMFNGIINNCSPSSAVSILEIHGTEDEVTLYNGDLTDSFWGPYPGQEEVLDFWVENNECSLLESAYFPNLNTSDGSEVYVEKYNSTSAAIWFYKIEGGGHDWPGSSGNMDIDASREIWMFFEQSLQENTAVQEVLKSAKLPVKTIDFLGREAKGNGMVIDLFEDGSSQKRFVQDSF
mgnify:FL=1